jgi:hypothetical protein
MPSIALHAWQTRAQRALDEVEAAHAAITGSSRGRRLATRQINHAYVVLLCSHFQHFCRELHSEAAAFLSRQPAFVPVQEIFYTRLTEGRRLNFGNANPGNLGSDFGRLGLNFWGELRGRNPRNAVFQSELGLLNEWRNAIAHQDFTNPALNGRDSLRVAEVRKWRSVCHKLALEFDEVLNVYFISLVGKPPW